MVHVNSRIEAWSLPSIALALYMALLLAIVPPSEAMRMSSLAEREATKELWRKAADPAEPQVEIQNITMSVDHFGSVQYSEDDTFLLRYFLLKPTSPPTEDSPIFLFCGGEKPITDPGVGEGAYADYANSIGALQIWPEHRYYAEESPFTPVDNLAHFTIEQALVDYIELVLHIQKSLDMTRNPVIAIGSSYSGQLSSYLRVRYPDVIAGAISSSPTSFGCPGLGLDPSYDPYGFAKVATNTASSQAGAAEACSGNVQKFFQQIFDLGRTSSGLDQINQAMSLCSGSRVESYTQLNSTLARFVREQWVSAAQYNAPNDDYGAPAYRVRVACDLLSDSSLEGEELMRAMVSAVDVFSDKNRAASECFAITDKAAALGPEPAAASAESHSHLTSDEDTEDSEDSEDTEDTKDTEDDVFMYSSGKKWDYQVCNQDQTPTSYNGVTDMFYDDPFGLDAFAQSCLDDFNIRPQYNWAAYNFGLSALRQSSNIFFTNGVYDPFIACGPTKNISETVTAFVYEGCHAYDMASEAPGDPPSVTAARKQGAKLISQWVEQYNSDKTTVPLSNAADLFKLSYSLGGFIDVVTDTLAGTESFTSQAILEPSAKNNEEEPLLG